MRLARMLNRSFYIVQCDAQNKRTRSMTIFADKTGFLAAERLHKRCLINITLRLTVSERSVVPVLNRFLISSFWLITLSIPNMSFAFGGVVHSAQNAGDGSEGARGIIGATAITLVVALPFAVSGTTKGLQKQAKQDDAFYRRFRENPRGMMRDLRRLDGPHFDWVLTNHTEVKPIKYARFRCEISRKRDWYADVLNKAKSKKRADIIAIANYLKRAKRATENKGYLNRCLLYERYMQNPRRFERQLTQLYGGADYKWLKSEYLNAKSSRVLTCELKRKQKALKAAFKAMRDEGHSKIQNLSQILHKIRTKANRSCR